MAGNYPDVPAPRFAFDIDGTLCVTTDGNRLNPVVMPNSSLQTLNDEVPGDYVSPGQSGYVTLIFPELRDITGYAAQLTPIGATSITTSVNTTNGVDGTWVSRGNATDTAGTKAGMRTGIQTVSWLGVKAVAFGMSYWDVGNRIYVVHLYGARSAGATPDRLRLWHPTLDQELTGEYFDWGDAVRGTTQERTFRVKNNSSSLTANSIVISTNALTDTSPTLGSQITYSDGGAFSTSINIGVLAPGAMSILLTVRHATSANATLSLWWWRTMAEAGSWT